MGWYENNKEEAYRRSREIAKANPERTKAYGRKSYHKRKNENVLGHLLRAAKARAKAKNVPFEITKEDITIPEYCPIMGCKLTLIGENVKTSPSIDRIIPELGYIKENIRVISTQANRMKWDSTPEELESFCRGVLQELGKESRTCPS